MSKPVVLVVVVVVARQETALTWWHLEALKHADGLIEDVLQAADINNDGKISFDG